MTENNMVPSMSVAKLVPRFEVEKDRIVLLYAMSDWFDAYDFDETDNCQLTFDRATAERLYRELGAVLGR